MINMIRCPRCEKEVGLPQGMQEAAEVECPLCKRSFILRDSYPYNLPLVKIMNPVADALKKEDAKNAAAPVMDTDAVSSQDSSLNIAGLEGLSGSNQSPGDGDTAIFSAEAGGHVFTGTSRSKLTSVTRRKRRVSPLVHLFGIVFFGIIGLVFGFAILCFFGKADPVLQILPDNSLKEWLSDINHNQR